MSIKFVVKQINSSTSRTAVDSVIGEYVFDGSLFTIGSEETNTIVLAGSAPEQAVVIQEGSILTLINSAEGTIFNNRTLRREAIEPINIGDAIKIGSYIISIVSGETGSEKNQIAEDFSTRPGFPIELDAPISKNGIEKTMLSETNGASELSEEKKPARNFADILNTLRTEEDSFYFIVKNGSNEEKSRIPLEQSEMPLGFDAQGEISCAVEQIAVLYAIVRKDWSGIVVESQRGGAVLVNDETITTTKRLRNRDRISFNAPRKGKNLPSLELHEPSSLVALESILETRPGGGNRILNGAEKLSTSDANASTFKQAVPFTERSFFGYFNFFEIAAMLIGTLIAAVLIFLLLEFIVG